MESQGAMATSDEPPPPNLTAGLSRGPWSPHDVVRRASPFWGAPPSTNFLDLNAPFEDDSQQLVSRSFPNLVDHLGTASSEGGISFLHTSKSNECEFLRPFVDASCISRNNGDVDGVSAARDTDSQQDTGPFVDYLSQFSGKKDVEVQEKDSPRVEREASDLPDDLLSLSSSYHKKRGESLQPRRDGQALFLAHGKVHDTPQQVDLDRQNVKDQRASASSGSLAISRLTDEIPSISHVGEGHTGIYFQERSLFPHSNSTSDRVDSSYPNAPREEKLLLPHNAGREIVDLSNHSHVEEKVLLPRTVPQRADSSKERISLSLKRSFEDMESSEEKGLLRRISNSKEGEESLEGGEAAQMKRRREAVGVPVDQRFQNDRRSQNDPVATDDKSIVWPPVVIIENTRLGWDEERKKWKGLGHDDIRKFLKNIKDLEYAKVKGLFDVNGQKSSSLVIFPPTYEGYFEAEALNDQLERNGKGRDQWYKVMPRDSAPRSMRGWLNTPGDLVSPDGRRVLYGYLATPEDIKRLDPHRSTLKWFIESFNEKVLKPAQYRHQMPL